MYVSNAHVLNVDSLSVCGSKVPGSEGVILQGKV